MAWAAKCGHRPREHLLICLVKIHGQQLGIFGNLVAKWLPCGHFVGWRKS